MGASGPSDVEAAARLFRGLGHPLRLRLLGAFEGGALSPSDAADLLDVPLGLVAYHMRTLRHEGLVELVDRRVARGRLQSVYRLSDRGRWARSVVEGVCDAIRDRGAPS
jgi:DNA-binding transcriptional ArsR family regulator